MPRFDFLLSENAERKNIASAILRAIPDDWDCLTGRLHHTPEVAAHLIDLTSPVYTISHGVGSWLSMQGQDKLDPYRAFGNEHLPVGVEFVFAGAKGTAYDLARCKKLAMHYIQLGYTGWIEAVPHGHKGSAPRVGVQLQLEPWDEPRSERYCEISAKANPPLIRMFYDERNGGNVDALVPILAAARRLKLLPLKE